MSRRRILMIGLLLLVIRIQTQNVGANLDAGVYQLQLQHPELPYYNVLTGTVVILRDITPQLITDYGSYENVPTIIYQPFILANKRLGASLDFEIFHIYFDSVGREIGAFMEVEYNYTTLLNYYSHRFTLQSYRGNYTGDYPIWSEVFAATTGTIWAYTYEGISYMNPTNINDVLGLSSVIQNDFNFILATNTSNNRVILEREGNETKTIGSKAFNCIRLKQSFYKNNQFTGHTYVYRTQIGNDYPLIAQEDYNKDGKRVLHHELVSLGLPKLGLPNYVVFPGGLMVFIFVWRIQIRRNASEKQKAAVRSL